MHEFDHRRKPTVGLASREARLTLVSNDSVWLNKNIYTTYNSTIYIYANENFTHIYKRKIHEYKLLYSTTQYKQSLSIKTLGDVNAVIYPPIKWPFY